MALLTPVAKGESPTWMRMAIARVGRTTAVPVAYKELAVFRLPRVLRGRCRLRDAVA